MISKQRMLQILERGSKDDSTSRMVDRLLGLLIILNVMAICLESVGHFGTAYEAQFWAFELFPSSFLAQNISCASGQVGLMRRLAIARPR